MPFLLQNNQLQVTIDKPGEVYNSCRFDWSGQVSQVILHNKHSFCITEKADGSEIEIKGNGLCNEFGIITAVGYDECRIGEYFPKIGVGLLKKELDEPYDFFKSYEHIQAQFEASQKSNAKANIKSRIQPCNGYAYALEKTFEVNENQLLISYLLQNTGAKAIITEEYCHNFVAIDKYSINNNYRLSFPAPINISRLNSFVSPNNCVEVSGNEISWNKTPESDFFMSDLNYGNTRINSWKIENTEVRVGMREVCNFNASKCNVWGKGHVISPEIFIQVSLMPGKTMSWERQFEFYTF